MIVVKLKRKKEIKEETQIDGIIVKRERKKMNGKQTNETGKKQTTKNKKN